MDMLAALAGWSLMAFAAVLFALQSVFREAGYALARARAERSEVKNEGASVITGSILGLLAFVLALTLSVASGRLADRRIGALQEANAIGTAWLQAEAISNPRAAEIARLVRDYAAQRIIYITADRGADAIGESDRATGAIQRQIWGNMTALLRDQTDASTVALMNSLGTMFDTTTNLRFAMLNGIPHQMVWLLLSFTLIGMGVVGYQLGVAGKPNRGLATIMCVLWTAVMVMILDMGTSRVGMLRTDMQAFTWMTKGFQEIPIPPLAP